MRFVELVPLLQIAVGPVILISGIGLLLLSMTNRFARVIDRTREIAEAFRHAPRDEARYLAQIRMLRRRANLLRLAIILSVASVLSAALLVIAVFHYRSPSIRCRHAHRHPLPHLPRPLNRIPHPLHPGPQPFPGSHEHRHENRPPLKEVHAVRTLET
jgi:hypothetical protein